MREIAQERDQYYIKYTQMEQFCQKIENQLSKTKDELNEQIR